MKNSCGICGRRSGYSDRDADDCQGARLPQCDTGGHYGGGFIPECGQLYGGGNGLSADAQAAGRAGRRDDRGRVFLQTYQPQHYAVQYAAKQDYEGFYEEEMLMRQMMGYPPFSAFFSILLTGAVQEEAAQAAQELAERLAQADEEEIATILGPTALPKFRGEYRYQIIVKAAEEEPLRQLVLPTAGADEEGAKPVMCA